MTDLNSIRQSRERFLDLVSEVRAELHRYCARMTGSVADGEDVVQDTLARAWFALAEMETLPPLRPWLFRIAHNRALDFQRRYERKMSDPLEAADDARAEEDPEAAIAREEALHAALASFLALSPVQRSCVVLKDVLGHSVGEIAALVGLSDAAVKSALVRGRASLREAPNPAEPSGAPSPALARYAALFNARDWDAMRAMLAEDVRLDVVNRAKREGRAAGVYYTKYSESTDWSRVAPGFIDGREVLGVFREGHDEPAYFIELAFDDAGRIRFIRDFRHVPYIGRDARFVPSK